jgi:hypothetical protein
MKKQVFAMFSSLTLLTAAGAFAQSHTAMYADIPFEFRVGTTILPAGHYDVRPQENPGVVLLRCHECKAGTVIVTDVADSKKTPEKGSLVFNRYDKIYFLSAIWTPGESRGRELRKSKSEREYARGSLTIPPVAVALAPQRPMR